MKLLLGGLAADTDDPMPDETRRYVQNHWKTIQKKVPGTQFNYEFWDKCNPKRSTYPACRAVIAARLQGVKNEDEMILAIQQGYYLEAKNPSDIETLISIATNIGLDPVKFECDLISSETEQILQQEISLTQQLGINGFPALLLKNDQMSTRLPINYIDPGITLHTINKLVYPDKFI